MKIQDGTGNGYEAGVDSENRIKVTAVIQTLEHHVNEEEQQSYNFHVNVTPTGADDCFCYIKNTSDKLLILEGYSLKLGANEYIDWKLKDTGTPAGGTSRYPAILNAGSNNIATGIFQTGVNITGLSGGTLVDRIYHTSSTSSVAWNFEQDIIIPKNQTCTVYCQTGGTALYMVIYMYFHPEAV